MKKTNPPPIWVDRGNGVLINMRDPLRNQGQPGERKIIIGDLLDGSQLVKNVKRGRHQ